MCDLLTENLHELINKEEYENKKLVRLIDYEKEKQTTLQTQINNLKSQIDETEKQNTLLNREVEDVERQVAANQSLIVTLTCANKMSHQHVSETYKKLARLQEDGKKRADQYEKALQRYRDTWSNHQKVYCSFPGVPQIMLLEDEVQTLQSKAVKELEEKLKDIRQKKQEISDPDNHSANADHSSNADQQVQNGDDGSLCEVAEQVTVSEVPMETCDTAREGNQVDQLATKRRDNDCVMMETSVETSVEASVETRPGDAMIVEDEEVAERVSELTVDEIKTQSSPYFCPAPTVEGDEPMQEVAVESTTILPSSSTPNIASVIPSVSPFCNVSPVLPDPNSDTDSILKAPSPAPTIHISSRLVNPGMVSSAAVSRRDLPISRVSAPNKPSPPSSPSVPAVKIPSLVPKLLKPLPRTNSPTVPKLTASRSLVSPQPVPQPAPRPANVHKPVPFPVVTTPKIPSQKPSGITTSKRAAPKLIKTPKPVATPKALCTPKLLSTPKPISTPKPMSTPKPICTPKPLSTPKPLNTPKPLSTPKLSSTPNKYTTPKGFPTKNVADLASANSPKFAGSNQAKNPGKEEYFTPSQTAPTNKGNDNEASASVFSTPANISPTKEVEDKDSSFALDQFATPQAEESMFEHADSTGDQFNFGFVESDSASNSAFGMFGGSEDSSDFGGDSGFGGDNSGGFAFSFGGEEGGSSSENNCNTLFG